MVNSDEVKYKCVYIGQGMLNAEMVKIFLESWGIKTMVSQESSGITFGLTIGPMGEAKVYVPEESYDQALELINSMESGQYSHLENQDNTNEDGSEIDDND
jgi:hypothetical protein